MNIILVTFNIKLLVSENVESQDSIFYNDNGLTLSINITITFCNRWAKHRLLSKHDMPEIFHDSSAYIVI